GKVVVAAIRETRRVPAHDHAVPRLLLDNRTVLEISGVHPTADGRKLSDLRPGDELDGVRVRDVTIVPYPYDATYDILPDTEIGAYFAGGVLIGSTLAKSDVIEVRSATAPACR